MGQCPKTSESRLIPNFSNTRKLALLAGYTVATIELTPRHRKAASIDAVAASVA